MVSPIWRHYTKDKAAAKATCNYCSIVLGALRGSTSNLWRHMESKHPEVQIVPDSESDPICWIIDARESARESLSVERKEEEIGRMTSTSDSTELESLSVEEWCTNARQFTIKNRDVLGPVIYRTIDLLRTAKDANGAIDSILGPLRELEYERQKGFAHDDGRSDPFRKLVYGLTECVASTIEVLGRQISTVSPKDDVSYFTPHSRESTVPPPIPPTVSRPTVTPLAPLPPSPYPSSTISSHFGEPQDIKREEVEYSSMELDIECPACELYMASSFSDYEFHLQTMHNLEPRTAGLWFSCAGCGVHFTSSSQVRKHLEEAARCNILTCIDNATTYENPLMTQANSALAIPSSSASTDKPARFNRFVRRSEIMIPQEGMEIVRSSKYLCPLCRSQSSTPCALLKHFSRYHHVTIYEVSSWFECACSQAFMSYTPLKTHVANSNCTMEGFVFCTKRPITTEDTTGGESRPTTYFATKVQNTQRVDEQHESDPKRARMS